MLIRFFRSSFLAQYALIVLTAVVLWFPAFLAPKAPAAPDHYSWFYRWIYDALSGLPSVSVILAFLLVLFQAFFLNAILANFQIIGRVSSLAAFIYVVMMSLSPTQTMLYPMLVAMPLLIYALAIFFRMYERTDNELDIFNVSFLISLASLFWFPAIGLVAWIFLSLLVLAITKLRCWIIPFVGILTPYLFLATAFFLRNELLARSSTYLNLPALFGFSTVLPGPTDLVIFGLMLLMALKAIQIAYSGIVDNNIAVRKRKALLNVLILCSLFLFLFRTPHPAHQMVLLLPISVFMAFSYTYIKQYKKADIFLILLIITALVNQYFSLLR